MDNSPPYGEKSLVDLTMDEAETILHGDVPAEEQPAARYPETAYVKTNTADEANGGKPYSLREKFDSEVLSDTPEVTGPVNDAKAGAETDLHPNVPVSNGGGSKLKAKVAHMAKMTPYKTPQADSDDTISDVSVKDVISNVAGEDSSEPTLASFGETTLQDNTRAGNDQSDEASSSNVAISSAKIQSAITLDKNASQQLGNNAKIANGNNNSSQSSKSQGKKALNMVDLDSSEDTLMRVSKHLPLNRHIYTICGPDGATGDKVSGFHPRKIDLPDDPYHNWPLYNDFRPIVKKDQTSWPPQYVNLQDWHVCEILDAGISVKDRHARWPADFSNAYIVHENRKPKGRAAKHQLENGVWHYYVLPNGYQFSGDEGSQAITRIPPIEGADKKQKRKQDIFSTGQDCEIQSDFEPTLDELQRGTLISRLPEGANGPRPLNNRPNWGPENRGNPRQKRGGKKATSDSQGIAATDTNARKRPIAESSTTSRKVAKTNSSGSPGSSSNPFAKTVNTALAHDIKGKGRAIESTGGPDDYIIVKPGIFNKAPRVQDGPVLTLSKLEETDQYFDAVLHQIKADLRQACISGNHEIAVSRVLSADNLLGGCMKALRAHFKKACEEVKSGGRQINTADNPLLLDH